MKQENKKKRHIMPWVILIVVIFGATFLITYAKQTGTLDQIIAMIQQYIGTQQPSETEGLPQESQNKVKTLENSGNYGFASWKEHIIMTGSSSVSLLDHKLNEVWYQSISGKNPALDTSTYGMVVYDKDGTNFSVITDDGKQNSVATEAMIAASINEKGYVTAITKQPGYKGGVCVYDNTGQALFKWNSGNWNILDAKLSNDGKTLAVSLLDTSAGRASGNVMLFDIAVSEKPFAGTTYPDNMVAALKWVNGQTLYCVGDTSAFALSAKGDKLWEYTYTGTLTQFAVGDNGILALNLQAYSAEPGKHGLIQIISASGKKTGECTISDEVKKIEVFKNDIYAMTLRDIHIINQSGKEKSNTSLDKDMRSAYILKQDEALIFYGTKLEVVPLN